MKKNIPLFTIVLVIFVLIPIKVNAMQLKAYADSGHINTIEVESSDTIEAVKEKIGIPTGKTINDTMLIYNGKELQNGRTLGDYSIKSTDILYMLGELYHTFNTNGGQFGCISELECIPDNQTEYLMPHYTLYEKSDYIIPKREGYTFKGWFTKSIGGYPIHYYNEYNLWDSEGTQLYAQWDIKGTITIDLVNREPDEPIGEVDGIYLMHLLKKGIINEEIKDNEGFYKNKDGKLLFSVNTASQLILANNLTKENNIVFILTEEEKNELKTDGVTEIPDKIELIVSTKEDYKIVFDANGGTFENNVKTIEIEDIINFDYKTFKKPTKDNYKFIGFYTKNGKSYDDIMNSEAGIEEDTIFYAKWELISSEGGSSESIPYNPEVENPETIDYIDKVVIIGTISLIGILITTIYLNKKEKKELN